MSTSSKDETTLEEMIRVPVSRLRLKTCKRNYSTLYIQKHTMLIWPQLKKLNINCHVEELYYRNTGVSESTCEILTIATAIGKLFNYSYPTRTPLPPRLN